MNTQVSEDPPAGTRSQIGLLLCSLFALVLFVPAFVLAFFLTYFSSVTEFFVGLRDGIYAIFSGRLVRSMILHHPQSKSRPDGDPSA